MTPSRGVTLSYILSGDPDPLISGNLVVENLFLPVVEVTLQVILPIAPPIPGLTLMDGSAAITLTADGGGGTLSTFGENPFWQGLIDGISAGAGASLFPDPFLLNSAFGGTDDESSFGSPIPEIGPAALDSIGIEINFSLTQLDQVSITSVFHVVGIPAPGVIGLLAVGAVGTRRRR